MLTSVAVGKAQSKETIKVMRFETWNVRTFLQAGNMNAIAEEADGSQWVGESEEDQGKDGLKMLRKISRRWE
jgi:hypothetical protein